MRAIDPFVKLRRHLLEQLAKRVFVQFRKVVGRPQDAEQFMLAYAPLAVFRGNRDDLLRDDVQTSGRNFHFVEAARRESRAPPRRNRSDRRATSRRSAPWASRRGYAPSGPTRWIAAEIDFGCIDLANQLDRAHIDAEFERCGRDDRLQLAALEALLGVEAFLAREAAVMRHDRIGAKPLLQIDRDALGGPAAQGEDQRGAMRHR